ncbi:MAG: phosphohydrolase [Methylophilaceae bacterium 17-44-8]|nr:MAG: phosphohydrolase [Methylophilaceae bacterium 17-44-8]
MSANSCMIDVNQLRVGLYVHLDLGWMDHPFTMSNFKLNDEEQIQKIKKIGLKTLRYDPLRSDCPPLPELKTKLTIVPNKAGKDSKTELETQAEATVPESDMVAKTAPVVDLKQLRHKQLHHAIDESEKRFVVASDSVKNIQRNIQTSPKACLEQATVLVDGIVECALSEGDIAIHALNGSRSSDAHYQHALNVTVISMILAKSIQMSKEDAQLLGLSAILHDIGKAKISDKILLKKEKLTHTEIAHYQQHSELGAHMIKSIGLSSRMAKIVLQHHEFADGSGYPAGLKTEQTDPLARIIVLANNYDKLCNPMNVADAKTPYEALAFMFAHQRSKFDEHLLKRLIKSLGVYPPGSIVKLSNEQFATVISVNPNHPLKPYIKLLHKNTEVDDCHIVDLREEKNLNITACLKPAQIPSEIAKHLNARKKVSYFIDNEHAVA